MKKITFILLALISGTAFAQEASATATVSAEIVSPISIMKTQDLSFGTIAAGNNAGWVKIAATSEGTRTSDNSDLLVTNSANTSNVAIFEINAASGFSYRVNLESDNLLSGSGADMAVTYEHNLNATANPGGGATDIVLYLGGTLNVGAGQEEGPYEDTVKVTVAYE